MHIFIFGCAGLSLLCGLFSSCSKRELLSSHCARVSHCRGLFCCGAWTLGYPGFEVAARGLSS